MLKKSSESLTDELKSRHCFSVDGDLFGEHCFGADPQAAFTVALSVDDHLFERFAVASNFENDVLVAFVVAVSSWFDLFVHVFSS